MAPRFIRRRRRSRRARWWRVLAVDAEGAEAAVFLFPPLLSSPLFRLFRSVRRSHFRSGAAHLETWGAPGLIQRSNFGPNCGAPSFVGPRWAQYPNLWNGPRRAYQAELWLDRDGPKFTFFCGQGTYNTIFFLFFLLRFHINK